MTHLSSQYSPVKALFLFVIVTILTACGGGKLNSEATTGSETNNAETALSKIVSYSQKGNNKPTAQDYQSAGVTGVTEENIDSMNTVIASQKKVDIDTADKIQNIADKVAICLQSGRQVTMKSCDLLHGGVIGDPVLHKIYGKVGSHAVADPWQEPAANKSVVYYPADISTDKPTPVIFFVPGWKHTHDTRDEASGAAGYESMLRFIASQGYSVIFARDDKGGTSAEHFIEYFKTTAKHPDIAPYIDTSRIGIVGFSSGGGHAFNILKRLKNDEGWGAKGRFVFVMEPWFAFDMSKNEMQTLPDNTNVVFVQFGEGGNNDDPKYHSQDPRIPLTEFYLLNSIPDEQKDYQIVTEGTHSYPEGDRPYSEMQGVLKPLDALMDYTFNVPNDSYARQTALHIGNDDPYADGHGIQVLNARDSYYYKCDDILFDDIDYCAIGSSDAKPYPPETTFTSIATNHSIQNPALKGKVIDPEFGTSITRLTDRAHQTDTPKVDAKGNRVSHGNSHPYPKTQAWNSDMTMFRMRYRLYDAETLEELPITRGISSHSELYYKNGALSEMKWSSTDPNVFYGVWSSQFWKGTIDRANNKIIFEESPIHDFSDIANFDRFTLGKYEGNIDFNDKYVVFAARKKANKYLTAIVYDIQNDKVLKVKDFPAAEWPDQGQVIDWISISPLGNHILLSSGGKIDQYTKDLDFVRHLSNSAGHGDLGIDQNGAEVYVQYEYGAERGIWIYRLSDGYRIRLLPDKYNGGHISCRNDKRRGWCYASTTKEGYREVIAIKLDYTGPDNHIVNRFVQTHTSGHNSMANVSPDGRRILFYSDWGDDSLHWVDKDSYHVTLP